MGGSRCPNGPVAIPKSGLRSLLRIARVVSAGGTASHLARQMSYSTERLPVTLRQRLTRDDASSSRHVRADPAGRDRRAGGDCRLRRSGHRSRARPVRDRVAAAAGRRRPRGRASVRRSVSAAWTSRRSEPRWTVVPTACWCRTSARVPTPRRSCRRLGFRRRATAAPIPTFALPRTRRRARSSPRPTAPPPAWRSSRGAAASRTSTRSSRYPDWTACSSARSTCPPTPACQARPTARSFRRRCATSSPAPAPTGSPPACSPTRPSRARRWLELGVRMVTFSVDTAMILAGSAPRSRICAPAREPTGSAVPGDRRIPGRPRTELLA